MDTEVIVEAFVVVVIGGLGSFWGTFLGALDLRAGALLRHPLLPALLDLLGLRPHGRGPDHPPLGPPGPAAQVKPVRLARIPWALLVLRRRASSCPALGSRFYTFLANDVVIWALFATSLNLLVGYTGLVSFGHAAYFGIGAYATGLLMKKRGRLVPARVPGRRGRRPVSAPSSSASSACASPASTSRCSPSPSPRSCGPSASSGTR